MNDNFDYQQPADLYQANTPFRSRFTSYRRFSSAALAIQFAVEQSPGKLLKGMALESADERYEGQAILNLYLAKDYPLARRET